MGGRNQHHIPRFFQRGFGVKRSGKPKEIWTFRKNEASSLGLIKHTAVDVDFYSSPSDDGSATLDDKITETETPLALRVRTLREQAMDAPIDPLVAADVVTQLAPRTSHLRQSMAAGLRQLTTSARELFADPQIVERIIGLDKDEPTDVFRDHFRSVLNDRPEFEALPFPPHVLERIAFCLAKENFESTIAGSVTQVAGALEMMVDGAPGAARDGHNRALAEANDVNIRRDLLETFAWTIAPAPPEGAILPDFIALASEVGADWLPLMFVGKQMDAVVMPLSKDRLLIGRQDASAAIDVSDINADTAACSHDFFLAAADADAFKPLATLIGERSRRYFEDATREAISAFLPASTAEPDSSTATEQPAEIPPDFRYELSFLGVADEETTQRINDVVTSVVAAFVRTYPMSRLEGITLAADYPAALRAVDQGIPGAAPVETVGPEIGVGIARRVVVVREGRAMARLVINGFVGHYLISEDSAESDWALNVFASQLALVALMDLVEQALPGVILNPSGTDYERFLYREADAAIHAYIAAYIGGGFGDPDEISATYRELLVNALDRIKTEIEKERLAYRTHADLDRLLAVAMPAVGFVLHFAAQLLGHATANARSALDDDGKLAVALDRSGLQNWLPDFQRHLERFRQRLGDWSSFNEFLAFNRHVERLLWSLGMFPWDTPNGPWIEIPLHSDALALMAEMGKNDENPLA